MSSLFLGIGGVLSLFADWQVVAVLLLVLLAIGYTGHRFWLFFQQTERNDNPCKNCTSHCELRDLYQSKQKTCSDKQKFLKKNRSE